MIGRNVCILITLGPPLICVPDEKRGDEKEEKIHGMVLISSVPFDVLMFPFS